MLSEILSGVVLGGLGFILLGVVAFVFLILVDVSLKEKSLTIKIVGLVLWLFLGIMGSFWGILACLITFHWTSIPSVIKLAFEVKEVQ